MILKHVGGLFFVISVFVQISNGEDSNDTDAEKAAESANKAVNAIYLAGGPDKILDTIDRYQVNVSDEAKGVLGRIGPYLDHTKYESDDWETQPRTFSWLMSTVKTAAEWIKKAVTDIQKAGGPAIVMNKIGEKIEKGIGLLSALGPS